MKRSSPISFTISIIVTLCAYFFLRLPEELCLLAGVVTFVASILPDIDSDSENTGKELGLIIAAVLPLVAIEFIPSFRNGSITRYALLVVFSYLITKIIFNRFTLNSVSYRGIMHSIPAAIITFDLTYLLFNDLHDFERLFISVCALIGFSSHLFYEAYSNLDLFNQAIGKGGKDKPVLKLTGASQSSTAIAYVLVCGLTYVVFQDLFPALENMRFPE